MSRLCIDRKDGESFEIQVPPSTEAQVVKVSIYKNRRDRMKIAIVADESVRIMRSELLQKDEVASEES